MRELSGLWSAAPDTSGKEVQEGLRLLEESQELLRTIVLGLALQYRSLDIEKCRLLGQSGGTDPKSMQVAASLVTLAALFGFQRQAEGLACESGDPMDVKLGAVSVLVGLIRLFRLCGETGEQVALEEAADPLV